MQAGFWRDCDLVESIPGKLNGRPVIGDTRVEATLVPESIELGQTHEQIAATYWVVAQFRTGPLADVLRFL